MTQASPPRPPRLAVWLIELFVPDEQASSVLGDLLEEFSDVAAKSGAAYARRWFWRQTVPTVSHLVRSGFQAAPWSTAGVVIGGLLLVLLGHIFSEWAIRTGTEFSNHHFLPPYQHFRFYVLLVNGGMYLIRLTVSTLIGCIVALLSKRREMSATLALSLVCSIPALTRFLLFFHGTKLYGNALALFYVLLYFFGGLFALVAGGAIVRSYRLRSLRAVSS